MVSGRVFWSARAKPGSAYIVVSCVDQLVREAAAGADGRFSVEGLIADSDCTLKAEGPVANAAYADWHTTMKVRVPSSDVIVRAQ
jgi:hypothetical protein